MTPNTKESQNQNQVKSKKESKDNTINHLNETEKKMEKGDIEALIKIIDKIAHTKRTIDIMKAIQEENLLILKREEKISDSEDTEMVIVVFT